MLRENRGRAIPEDGVSIGTATALRDSGKALLVSVRGMKETQWIPHDCIHDDSEVYNITKNKSGKLVVVESFAERKGWA